MDMEVKLTTLIFVFLKKVFNPFKPGLINFQGYRVFQPAGTLHANKFELLPGI